MRTGWGQGQGQDGDRDGDRDGTWEGKDQRELEGQVMREHSNKFHPEEKFI